MHEANKLILLNTLHVVVQTNIHLHLGGKYVLSSEYDKIPEG